MNMVSFIVPGSHAPDPLANDVCHDHMTQRESDAEDAAIAVFWQRLGIASIRDWAGMPTDVVTRFAGHEQVCKSWYAPENPALARPGAD